MSKTTIYFFSTTGNSLVVAWHLAEILGSGDPVSVPASLATNEPYFDALGADALGFVFPVHRASIPEMLRGFIAAMPTNPNCFYFAVSTFSLFGSNEFWDIDELLAAKGAALKYAAGIRMMGNVGLRYPSEATVKKRLEHMEHQVEEIAMAVSYRQENYFLRANKALDWAVRTYTGYRQQHIHFNINQRCQACGVCVQVCPAQNIQLHQRVRPTASSKPAFSDAGVSANASSLSGMATTALLTPVRADKCQACLACVHWCPQSAVSVSGRLHNSYHNPLVQPEQLLAPSLKTGYQQSTANTTRPSRLDEMPSDATPSNDTHTGDTHTGDIHTGDTHTGDAQPLLAKTSLPSQHRDRTTGQKKPANLKQAANMSNAEIAQALSALDLEHPAETRL